MEQITSYSKINCLIITALFLFCNCKSQNLIRNSSFEDRGIRDLAFILNKKICKYWYNASKATPDYFKVNSSSFYNVPNNKWGSQEPKSGNSYVGIDVNYNDFEYEYLKTKLTKPLKEKYKYCFTIHISLADKFDLAINEFQFALTQKNINYSSKEIFKYSDINSITSPNYFSDQENWIKLSTIYLANGGESYLTLGIFNDKKNYKNVSKKNTRSKFKGSYYYIDDVSLIEIKDSSECICKVKMPDVEEEKIKVDTVKSVSMFDEAKESSFILKNIYFETNKSNLLPNSYFELDGLVNYLKKNPTFKIEIIGYTDNSGNEGENQILSEQRAKAVAEYLREKGIVKERIHFLGNGIKNPIAPNDTEVNKAKNRRVEIKILP